MQHLDEGTIHAWLDDQLPPAEARSVEAHVAECRPCADAVAEARGLIAASSRILSALDDVPRGVVPKSQAPRAETPGAGEDATAAVPVVAEVADEPRRVPVAAGTPAERRAWRRWFNAPSLAAAATIIVAVGTFTVLGTRGKDARSVAVAPDAAVPAGASVAPNASVAAPSATPAPSLSASAEASADRAAGGTIGVSSTRADAPARQVPQRRAVAQLAAEGDQVAAGESKSMDSARAKDERSLADAAARSAADRIVVDRPAVAEDRKAREVVALPPPPVPASPGARNEVPRVAPDTAPVQVFRGTNAVEGRRFAKAEPQASAAGAAAATPTATTGAVRGRVTDGNNTGLANALVSVPGTSTGVSTNDAGEFALGGLQPGTQRLTVRRIGYGAVTRDVTVAAGQTTTTDVVLRPAEVALQEVVVTGAAARDSRVRDRVKAAAPAEIPPGAPVTAAQSNAVGCYELGVTPTSAQARTTFAQVPRRIALDAEIVPANADGVWYRARDLAQGRTVPDGLWRPAGPEAVEIEWSSGTRTTRVRLSGSPGSLMRGTVEEIDRAAATGEAGTVVALRRPCGG